MNERRDLTPEQQASNVSTATQEQQNATARAAAGDQQRVPVERGEMRSNEARAADAQDQSPDVELLPREALADFQARWERVQVMFVDQPRDAVQQAQDLVDQLVNRLTESFGNQRQGLMAAWTRGEDVSTEDLRLALRRYHSFFNRLLST